MSEQENSQELRDETKLCHDEGEYAKHQGAIVPPLYQNSLFAFEDWDAIDHAFDNIADSFVYSRLMNPTVTIAEKKIAELCRGEKAKLCASGMAAISAAIMHFVKAGDHIITIKNVYGPANSFIGTYLKEKNNIDVTYIKGTDISEFERAIQDNTTLIYLESPASQTFELQDLRAVAVLAKSKGIKTVIDNTWCSPIFQKPLELGIDMEVHSASKYLCGHSDVVSGVLIGNKDDVDEIIVKEHAFYGGKMAPFEAWLILRSLRTLTLRMERHQQSALKIASFLEGHKKVKKVNYPGLPSFPQHALAQKQMTGYGGLLSIVLDIEDISEAKRFVNKLVIFKLGVSWGGHESLVYAPTISYAKELTAEQLEAMSLDIGLVRLSIGLEHPEDLIKDLEQGFQALNRL